MYVLVNKSMIDRQTSNINGYIRDYRTGINNLKQTVREIGNIWSGSDYEQFVNKMDDFIADLTRLADSLDSYVEFVNQYIKAVSVLDSEYGQKRIALK